MFRSPPFGCLGQRCLEGRVVGVHSQEGVPYMRYEQLVELARQHNIEIENVAFEMSDCDLEAVAAGMQKDSANQQRNGDRRNGGRGSSSRGGNGGRGVR